MKTLPVILFLFLTLASISTFGQMRSISGTYYTTRYYSGLVLTLNPDMTFTLKYQGHLFSDTAAGIYIIAGDTISLTYAYNEYEQIFNSCKEQNKEVPIDIQLSASRVVLRPKTLIKKHSKLYVVNKATNGFKTEEYNGRRKKIYLQKVT